MQARAIDAYNVCLLLYQINVQQVPVPLLELWQNISEVQGSQHSGSCVSHIFAKVVTNLNFGILLTVKSLFYLVAARSVGVDFTLRARGSEIFALLGKLLSTVKANCVIIRRFCQISRCSADSREDGISKPCPLFVKKQKKAMHQNSFDWNNAGKMSAAISWHRGCRRER